jgi:acyl carrier protein
MELNVLIIDRDKPKYNYEQIKNWIVSYLAELLEADSDIVDITAPFDRYGLDSHAIVGLSGDLEDWLKIELEPTLLYDYPTIEALANYLADELKTTA